MDQRCIAGRQSRWCGNVGKKVRDGGLFQGQLGRSLPCQNRRLTLQRIGIRGRKDDDAIGSDHPSAEKNWSRKPKMVRPAGYAFHKSVPVRPFQGNIVMHAYQRGRSRILICYGVWVWHTKNLLYSIGKQLQSLYCNLIWYK